MNNNLEKLILDGIVCPITADKNITLSDIIKMPLQVESRTSKLILSSMLVDWDWLFDTVGHIPMTVLIDGTSSFPIHVSKTSWLKGIAHQKNSNCHIIAPVSAPYSKMHTKLAIVMNSSFVRIMITSANLVQGDWEERSNVAYIQDFPSITQKAKPPSDFGSNLGQLLQSMGLPSGLNFTLINSYDYSKSLVRVNV